MNRVNHGDVASWQNRTLCMPPAVCFSQGTMPLSVRVKHRCKESIKEMDLYLTCYNIYPCSNCLFWYKKIKIKVFIEIYWNPRLMTGDNYCLFCVVECMNVMYEIYDIITVNMNIFFSAFASAAGFYWFLMMSNVVLCSRDSQLLGREGEPSADSLIIYCIYKKTNQTNK